MAQNMTAVIETLKEYITCPICFNIFGQPKSLDCRHTLCNTCLNNMIAKKQANSKSPRVSMVTAIKCPMCRQTTKIANIKTDFNIAGLIETLNFEDCEGNTTGQSFADDFRPRVPSAPPCEDDENDNHQMSSANNTTAVPSAPPAEYVEHVFDPIEHNQNNNNGYPEHSESQPSNNSGGPNVCLGRTGTAMCLPKMECPIQKLVSINGCPALLLGERITLVSRKHGLLHWYGDRFPKAFQSARDCTRITNHESHTSSYVIACDDSDYGLMQFTSNGRFMYTLAEGGFCSVASHDDTLFALNHERGEVLVSRFDAEKETTGDEKPWQRICVFPVHQDSCTPGDSIAVVEDSLYVCSALHHDIHRYTLDGEYIECVAEDIISHGNVQPKIRTIGSQYLIVLGGKYPQVLDVQTRRLTRLQIKGASRHTLVDISSDGDKVWVMWKSSETSALKVGTFYMSR